MEALKNLGVEWPYFVSQVVNFAIFFYLINRFLYKPVLGMLDKRSAEIEKGLNEARTNIEQNKKSSEERAAMFTDAKKQAHEVTDNAILAATRIKDEILKDAHDKAAEILELAEKRNEEDRRRMFEEVKEEARTLAHEIAEKILREKIGPGEEKKMIDRSAK